MSIRGPARQRAKGTKLKNFRCSEELDAYLEDASRRLVKTQQDIIVEAIELDRDLSIELRAEGLQLLRGLGHSLGINFDEQPAKVIAIAAMRGLEAQDPSHRKPKK